MWASRERLAQGLSTVTREDCNLTKPSIFLCMSLLVAEAGPDVGEARGVNCHIQKDLMGKDTAEVV